MTATARVAALLAVVALLAGCAGLREQRPQLGMSRQQVLESSTAGLPKRQEATPDGTIDFYDWGSVRYDDQQRVVQVLLVEAPDPAVTTTGVVPALDRLERVRRVAVVAPTVEIYRAKLFGADEPVAFDVKTLRAALSALIAQRITPYFGTVTELSPAEEPPSLLQAQARFQEAVGPEFLEPLRSDAPADTIRVPLGRSAQDLEVDALLVSTMSAIVREVSAAAGPAAPSALCARDVAPSGLATVCGHYAPPPVFIPIYPMMPTHDPPPPVVASLSIALVAAESGEILWSHVGSQRGSIRIAEDISETRLRQLVETALPDPRLLQS